MKVVILAGGYATRLMSVTEQGKIAKTLLPINVDGKPRPILHHLLEKVAVLDEVDEIILIVNDKYKQQINDSCAIFAAVNNCNKQISIYSDGSTSPENATGANNAMRVANGHIPANYRGQIMVMASDNYFEFPLSDLADYYYNLQDKFGDYINVIVSKVYPDNQREFIAKNFGILNVDENNQILSLDEKPGIENLKSNNVSLALYVLNRQDFALIDQYMDMTTDPKKRDSMGYFVNYLITTNQNCYTYPYKGLFCDIGTPDEYYSLIKDTKNILK